MLKFINLIWLICSLLSEHLTGWVYEVSIILILGELLLRSKILSLLRHELLLGLLLVHTIVILVHLLLHLTRLEIHWHLLLLLLGLTVQNLHALGLVHPALVAILSEGEVVVEASLASPVSNVSLLVGSLSFLLSVVKSMVVFFELYDSVTSGDSDKLVTLLNDLVHFRSFLNTHLFSLLLSNVTVFFGLLFLALVASFSSFTVEVFAWIAFPTDHWVNLNLLNILGERLYWEDRAIFWARIVATWRIVSCFNLILVIKNVFNNVGFHSKSVLSNVIVAVKKILW